MRISRVLEFIREAFLKNWEELESNKSEFQNINPEIMTMYNGVISEEKYELSHFLGFECKDITGNIHIDMCHIIPEKEIISILNILDENDDHSYNSSSIDVIKTKDSFNIIISKEDDEWGEVDNFSLRTTDVNEMIEKLSDDYLFELMLTIPEKFVYFKDSILTEKIDEWFENQ